MVRLVRIWFLVMICALVVACDEAPALLAPDVAQPVTRPARNFTSFDGALRCMDRLLTQSKRPTVLLSSTGIADHTRRINVAGDDMLINALVRMTRNSKSYIFLDQGLVSAQGLIDLLVVQKTDTPRPSYYVRGAISQLDSGVVVDDMTISLDRASGSASGVQTTQIENKNQISVVSVDLHLVGFPSRRVVPGASVANSMVVQHRNRGFESYGLISMTGVDLELQVDRLESTGQAVRNLIEVSLIELIGKHSGVPYWTCLSDPNTNAQKNSDAENSYAAMAPADRIKIAQQRLKQLGLFTGQVTGVIDPTTRAALADFQARENLLVSGVVDFDTFARLDERIKKGAAPMPVRRPLATQSKTSTRRIEQRRRTSNSQTDTDSTQSLRDFLPLDLQRTERRGRSNESFQSLDNILPPQ